MSTDLSSLPLEEINAQRSWHNREYNVLTHELHRRARWKVPLAKVCHPPKEFRMPALVYPTEVPTAEVLKLLKIIRSPDRMAHRTEAIHLAIHIELYAAYLTVGQPTDDGAPLVTRSMEADAEPSPEFDAAVSELDGEINRDQPRAFGAPGGRWKILLDLALKILPLFL
jgi:hypothetical protein